MINLTTIEEYNYSVSRGFEPLIDGRFILSIELRKEIQQSIFTGTIPEKNDKFYHWNWDKKPHICEECNTELTDYSSKFISHILSRQNEPAMAHDPRNTNILCLTHHHQWENIFAREQMRIYRKNLRIIENLRNEYYRKCTL